MEDGNQEFRELTWLPSPESSPGFKEGVQTPPQKQEQGWHVAGRKLALAPSVFEKALQFKTVWVRRI